ncbi:hypothetical protein PSQ39_06595 [Curvibacter sp. HBC28]|uniref:SGNH/GDSL hydrolase family protein n=1 Tax=Curvibacter microcysteis TaxID=3026419 RepID=A0ABT5MCI4_9BURK|nr:hypothetical protein [Curvibacter sp. HBC28]MDD0814295.1 hypothetical protein [Curvibacter sp. HBC28]
MLLSTFAKLANQWGRGGGLSAQLAGLGVGYVPPLSMNLLAPSTDVPTISYAASSGWGALGIYATDARITYWGSAQGVAPDNTNGFGQMKSLSTSQYVGALPFFHEYGFDGSSLTIRAGVDSGKQKFFVWVDGRLAATSTAAYSATAGTTDIVLTFGAAKPRVITFLSTWGPHVITPGSATNTVWKVTRPKGRRAAFVTDSWGSMDQGDALDGWAYKLALAAGYCDIIPSGQGGTGYYASGTAGQGRRSFSARLHDEVLVAAPDDIFVGGSINDLPSALPGVNRSLVTAAITSFYSQIAASAPRARVYAFGVQYVRPDLTATYAALEAEFAAATSAYPFVQRISTQGWLTGTGNASATAGDGNRDVYRDSTLDHCTNAGYSYYAQRALQLFTRVNAVP